MIKILLSGCFGRMCVVAADEIAKKENVRVECGVDICRDLHADFPTYGSFSEVPTAPDAIIDFSNPSNLDDLLDYCIKNHVPAVIATTGFSDEQIKRIHDAAKSVPLFFSFNMSLGVNLMVGLAKRAAEVLGGDFDIEIVEKHHNRKLDAPSGTALMIADALNSTRGNALHYEFDRHSRREARKPDEIGIHSVRGGTIVGEHDIIFAGNDETLTISHSAQSKALFAVGAVRAAEFIVGKPAGLYDMNDMLDI